MSPPRCTKLVFSPEELDEIINCVAAALYGGLAYGHVTSIEQAPMEEFRSTLLERLKEAYGQAFDVIWALPEDQPFLTPEQPASPAGECAHGNKTGLYRDETDPAFSWWCSDCGTIRWYVGEPRVPAYLAVLRATVEELEDSLAQS